MVASQALGRGWPPQPSEAHFIASWEVFSRRPRAWQGMGMEEEEKEEEEEVEGGGRGGQGDVQRRDSILQATGLACRLLPSRSHRLDLERSSSWHELHNPLFVSVVSPRHGAPRFLLDP